jgi:hypothetical protein
MPSHNTLADVHKREGKGVFVFLLLTLLALAIHAIVLKFIFPGYYSPLYPHHSDFYIPVALAHSPGDFFQYKYLGYSRPLGIFFLKLMGFLGVHGAILFTIINVAANCSLSAILLQRILRVEFKWPFVVLFCIYCYLLFSQPYFYTFYTQDVLSHLSYFFLIAGAFIFYKFYNRHMGRAYGVLFLSSMIAFLCKETYGLSALVFAFAWLLYDGKKSSAASLPLITIGGALILVLAINLFLKSTFIRFGNVSPADPYFINLKPASVFREICLYAGEGLNFAEWMMVGIMGFLIVSYSHGTEQRSKYLFGACLAAAFFSWVPNAIIPNHHNGGYSFNGAYLLYLPLIFIPIMWCQEIVARYLIALLLIAGFVSPFFSQKAYGKQWWVLEQETSQRNILHALDRLMGQLSPGKDDQHILITGLTMPFFPFHHPLALMEYPNSQFATYDVINYSQTATSGRYHRVKFIKPADVEMRRYNQVWMFAGNGALIGNLMIDSMTVSAIEKNNCLESVVYPDSTRDQELLSIIKYNSP